MVRFFADLEKLLFFLRRNKSICFFFFLKLVDIISLFFDYSFKPSNPFVLSGRRKEKEEKRETTIGSRCPTKWFVLLQKGEENRRGRKTGKFF